MSDNWIIQNLSRSVEIWNEKLEEIRELLTLPPEQFRDGSIWRAMLSVNEWMQALGYALLVLFFLGGVLRTAGSFAEARRPEHAVKMFIRFALAKGAVGYGMELLGAVMDICQGIIAGILERTGTPYASAEIPAELTAAVESCGFLESVPLWAVSLIGGLLIWVLSFTVILNVYGRFFRLYLYAAIAPVPLAAFAGEPTQSIGISFLRSFCAVCMEGTVTALACVIFSAFASGPPSADAALAPAAMLWTWMGELIFNMLILVGTVRMSDRVIREIMGI